MNDEQIDEHLGLFLKDFRTVELPIETKAMLEFAELLTLHPASVTAADIERLRQNRLDDRAIHDLCAIVAYFCFANRMAQGLGLELESRFNGIPIHKTGRREDQI